MGQYCRSKARKRIAIAPSSRRLSRGRLALGCILRGCGNRLGSAGCSIAAPAICAWQPILAFLGSIEHLRLGRGWVLGRTPIHEADAWHLQDSLSASMRASVSPFLSR